MPAFIVLIADPSRVTDVAVLLPGSTGLATGGVVPVGLDVLVALPASETEPFESWKEPACTFDSGIGEEIEVVFFTIVCVVG